MIFIGSWRDYHPGIGRWMSVDPLASKYTSYSPYNYTLNNPINAVDPDGRGVIKFFVRNVKKFALKQIEVRQYVFMLIKSTY